MQTFWRFAVCMAMATGLPGDVSAVEGPYWIETEPGFEVEMQPQMLRRRYGAVVTRQEIVAQELENSVSVADEIEFIRWRQSQAPQFGWFGPGFWGPGFWGGGFWGPRFWAPGFWGPQWGGSFRAPMAAPGIAPWGPNTMTQPTGELYW